MKKLPNGLIDIGGGATPRDPSDKSIILNAKGAPTNIPPERFKMLLKKFQETKRLDREDFSSGAEIGRFIDFYNQTVREKKERDFDDNINQITKWLIRAQTEKHIIL